MPQKDRLELLKEDGQRDERSGFHDQKDEEAMPQQATSTPGKDRLEVSTPCTRDKNTSTNTAEAPANTKGLDEKDVKTDPPDHHTRSPTRG